MWVVDRSSSLTQQEYSDSLTFVNNALTSNQDTFNPSRTNVGFVSFGAQPYWNPSIPFGKRNVISSMKKYNPTEVTSIINTLKLESRSGMYTNTADAMNDALDEILAFNNNKVNATKSNLIFLLTDGQPTVYSPEYRRRLPKTEVHNQTCYQVENKFRSTPNALNIQVIILAFGTFDVTALLCFNDFFNNKMVVAQTFNFNNLNDFLPIIQDVTCPVSAPPTLNPTQTPTKQPTNKPTPKPTSNPTNLPTLKPTQTPTKKPTKNPTNIPTNNPTQKPTNIPTNTPTLKPTKIPTNTPTNNPSSKPTQTPTNMPTNNPIPNPTKTPTQKPTSNPINFPTKKPTNNPTTTPTSNPTKTPTYSPTMMTVSPTEFEILEPVPRKSIGTVLILIPLFVLIALGMMFLAYKYGLIFCCGQNARRSTETMNGTAHMEIELESFNDNIKEENVKYDEGDAANARYSNINTVSVDEKASIIEKKVNE